MNKKQRKNFLTISSVLYLVAFIIHCLWTTVFYNLSGDKLAELGIKTSLSMIVFALIAAYAVTSLYYLIKLSTSFLEKRKLWFRVLLTVFAPITIPLAVVVSFVITLPYGLFNIVKIYSAKGKKTA